MRQNRGCSMHHRTILAGTLALLVLTAGSAGAQGKKLYCWKQNGHTTCGDTLPPGAVDLAHSEISEKSGMTTGTVDRSLTAEERAVAATAADQAQAAAVAEAEQQRRDLAMVESYDSEADLRRAYGERITLVELSIKSSQLTEQNLRTSLISLLEQASENELAGKPVVPAVLANLRDEHQQLQSQLRILAQQQADRASLDGELADAVERYRKLKQPPAAAVPATPPPG